MKWIKDEEFIRGNIPMTKFEVRMVTIALLEINERDTLLDIGAGTGSISVEAALHGARVYSIEREEEGIRLIKLNSEKFNVKVELIKESAPSGIDIVPDFNKCFIGGTGGKLIEIIKAVNKKLQSGGIIAANFITLGNLSSFISVLNELRYENIETRLIQSSSVDCRTGLLKANNPVFIVRGTKS